MSDSQEVILKAVEHHALWRSECLELNAAETMTSPAVRELLSGDAARRYTTRTHTYSGSRYLDTIEEECEAVAKRLFGADVAIADPISGHMTVLATLLALTKPGDRVLALDPADGGYPLAITPRIGVEVTFLPFDHRAQNIVTDATVDLVERTRPTVLMLGASRHLFPHPVAPLVEACRSTGTRIVYDAAHPLGLIAGGAFPNPLADGADVLIGSTNKTFFGPHRGLILLRDASLADEFTRLLRTPPFLQSSHHVGTLVGLAMAMAEMEAFGRDYASATVRNAQALAGALAADGVPLLGSELGYTASHQVVLDTKPACSGEARSLQVALESANILGDCVVRLGTQQVTRQGMGPDEMRAIAALIARVRGGEDRAPIRRDTRDLVARFPDVGYRFSD